MRKELFDCAVSMCDGTRLSFLIHSLFLRCSLRLCFATSTGQPLPIFVRSLGGSMNDSKALATQALVIEVVAGNGTMEAVDGPLGVCAFTQLHGLCRYGDSLIVADMGGSTIRTVEGVLGVADPLAESKAFVDMPEYEARAVPLIMAAVEVLPKELARMMAQYALPIRGHARTIAGAAGVSDHVDGPALSHAKFRAPMHVAVDTTDPIAGPQLLIGVNGGRVRCFNMRTRMVTTIAGTGAMGHVDGSALQARFGWLHGIAVAPSGVLYVADGANGSVRRVSAAKWPASGAAPAQRVVTTLVGDAHANVHFAQSSAQSFRRSLNWPCTVALDASLGPSALPNASTAAADDRDVGRLYVGSIDGVHAFDLASGQRKHFHRDDRCVNALALTEDGTRLFAVSDDGIDIFDTRTGAFTVLVDIDNVAHSPCTRAYGPIRPVIQLLFGNACGEDSCPGQAATQLAPATGCVIDKATRSLVVSAYGARRIIRLRGVDV